MKPKPMTTSCGASTALVEAVEPEDRAALTGIRACLPCIGHVNTFTLVARDRNRRGAK